MCIFYNNKSLFFTTRIKVSKATFGNEAFVNIKRRLYFQKASTALLIKNKGLYRLAIILFRVEYINRWELVSVHSRSLL